MSHERAARLTHDALLSNQSGKGRRLRRAASSLVRAVVPLENADGARRRLADDGFLLDSAGAAPATAEVPIPMILGTFPTTR